TRSSERWPPTRAGRSVASTGPRPALALRCDRRQIARWVYSDGRSIEAEAPGDRADPAQRLVESREKIRELLHQFAGDLVVRRHAVHRLQNESFDLAVLIQSGHLRGVPLHEFRWDDGLPMK